MALIKAFVCQIFLFGIYKLFLEQVVEEHLVPDELIRNCLCGFICLLCFGIQLYTDKVEEQKAQAESSRTKSRRWSPPDTVERVSEFLDERQIHMMRTIDAAMANMGPMPMADGYVHNVVFATAGPEVSAFTSQPDVIVMEEIHVAKFSDTMSAKEPVVISSWVDDNQNETEEAEVEEVDEEECETKSDVCEEEEDVVTVIDTSKQNQTVEKVENAKTESEKEQEDEEEEEEEEEVEEEVVEIKKPPVVDIKKNEKAAEEKRDKEPSDEEVEEEEEEEESEEEVEVKPVTVKLTKKS